MCLSTVYLREQEKKEPVAKNVASVRLKDGKLVLTDILGVTTELDAELETIDLMDNFIYVRRK